MNTLKVLFNWSRARLFDAISAADVDKQVRASLPELERSIYLRHDPEFAGDLPRLDDTKGITSFREKASESMSQAHTAQIKQMMISSSFFFELRQLPTYDGEHGTYLCEGTIKIRGDPNLILELIANSEPEHTEITFVRNGEVLQDDRLPNGVCGRCRLYQHHVRFHVRKLSHMQTVYLQFGAKVQHRISGFPQTMTWFCEQQGLYDVFSTRQTVSGSCICNDELKQRCDELDGRSRGLHESVLDTITTLPKRKRKSDGLSIGLTERDGHRDKRSRSLAGEPNPGYL